MVKTVFRSGTIRNVRQYGYISVKKLLTTCATILLWCYLVLFCAMKLQGMNKHSLRHVNNWNVSIVLPQMFVKYSSNELASEQFGPSEEHDSQLRVHLTHKMQRTQENVNSSQKVIINNVQKIRTSRRKLNVLTGLFTIRMASCQTSFVLVTILHDIMSEDFIHHSPFLKSSRLL